MNEETRSSDPNLNIPETGSPPTADALTPTPTQGLEASITPNSPTPPQTPEGKSLWQRIFGGGKAPVETPTLTTLPEQADPSRITPLETPQNQGSSS